MQGHLLLIRYHRVLTRRRVYPTTHVTAQIDEIVFPKPADWAEAFFQSKASAE